MPDAPERRPRWTAPKPSAPIIRRRREALGLSLRAFARQCDLSPAHLSKMERGLASPSLVTLTRIVQELDLHGADLFGLAAMQEHGTRVVRAARRAGPPARRRADRPASVRVAAQTPVATVVLGAGGPGHFLPRATSDRAGDRDRPRGRRSRRTSATS